ncbi:hypothetical protein BGZ51_007028 [Haplosporangium sp. Z 767]|nr:hypothetical protein BGZ51_007028 [Haplosporangium sp. Z 767]
MSSQLSRDSFGAALSTSLDESGNPLPSSTPKDEIAPTYTSRQLTSPSHTPSLSAPSAPSLLSSSSPPSSSSSLTSSMDGSRVERVNSGNDSADNRDNGGIENMQIQVSSTIQTVLISLGICVGILFLLGIIASRIISHKNKRASKKKSALEASNGGNSKQGGGGGAGKLNEKTSVTNNSASKIHDEKSSMVSIVIDEKNIAANTAANAIGTTHSAGVGVGTGGTTRAQEILASLRRSRSNSNSVYTSHPGSTQSPKSSIVGGVGMAVGGGGPSGTGSFQMNISGPHGPGTVDPRNSFIEAGHPPYGRRPSLTPAPTSSIPLRAAFPGFGQQHHSNLQIGIYSQEDTAAYNALDLSSPMFTISPSTAGTDSSDRNPFASPPLSAGLKSSTPLDPFRTPNSSQFNLNLTMPGTASRGLGYNPSSTYSSDLGEDNDPYSFLPLDGPSSSANMKNGDMAAPTHTGVAGSGTSAYNGSPMNTPLTLSYTRSPSPLPLRANSTVSTHSFSTAAPPARTLDDLSEPKLVLRQLQSASPAYHRHTLMHMAPSLPSSGGAIATSSNGAIPKDIHGSSSGAATTRATVERQASVSPGVCDRRSLAGSVVVPSSSSSSSGSDRQSIGASSINEGNAWYRKRASVVIPEGGTAHVRLWRDDGEAVAESGGPMGVRNRSSRSGSQSSSQSQGSNHSGSVGTRSPLRLNRLQYQTPEESDEGEDTRQAQKRSPPTSSTHLPTFEAHSQAKKSEKGALSIDTVSCESDEPSPRSVRNGAAVFEGLGLQASKGSLSRAPSPSRAHPDDSCTVTIMNTPVVIEPEQNPSENERHVTKPNNSVVTITAMEEQEQVDQVVVRLRTPRRGSHSGSCSDSIQRRSYLDDYREQQQQLKA